MSVHPRTAPNLSVPEPRRPATPSRLLLASSAHRIGHRLAECDLAGYELPDPFGAIAPSYDPDLDRDETSTDTIARLRDEIAELRAQVRAAESRLSLLSEYSRALRSRAAE